MITRNVPVLTVVDGNGTDPSGNTAGHLTVYEASLSTGSDPTATSESAQGQLTIGLLDPLAHVRIGTDTSDASAPSAPLKYTQVTGDQLQALNPADPGTHITVTTPNGTITLTGYDPGTGVIDYTYTLREGVTHANVAGNNTLTEALEIRVTDTSGDARIDTLNITIVDDIPVPANPTPATVEEGATVAIGSGVGNGQNLLQATDAKPSADGGKIYDITYTDDSGASVTALVPDDSNGVTVKTSYGSLTVKADGSWTYTPVASADHTKPDQDASLRDDFSFRVIDGDGDISTASGTQQITVTDTAPSVGSPADGAVNEALVAGGSVATGTAVTTGGTLGVSAGKDSIDTTFEISSFPQGDSGLTSGGVKVIYTLSTDGHTLHARKEGSADTDPDVFTVTITDPTSASAAYSFTLIGTLDHASADGTNTLDLNFGFTVTDSDGDSAPGSFKVTVTDDVPVANDDSNTVGAALRSAVNGNVITETGAGLDTTGADGAKVTQVQFVNPADPADIRTVTVNADGSDATIHGTYGTLVIHADGSYTYTRTAGGTAGDASDEFTYTLTDTDGDPDTAKLTINTTNANVSITGLTAKQANGTGGDAVVYENALSNGSNPASTAEAANGDFSISAIYGVKTLTLTQGSTVTTLVSGGVFTSATITTAMGNELKITGYNSETGVISYTYTLADNEAHGSGNNGIDSLFEDFAIELKDEYDNTATDTLSVRIVDDIPVITQTGATVSLIVDETTLNTDATDSFAGLFDIKIGADNGTGSSTVYRLSTSGTSGLTDTATGQPVTLTANADGTKITGTVTEGGSTVTVLEITLNPATGGITLDQQRAVKHPTGGNASPDEPISITGSAVKLTATATDSDGDVVSSTVDIGNRLSFKDDGPSVTAGVNGAFTQPTLTTQDGKAGATPDTATGEYAGAFTSAPVYGADGQAASNPQTFAYALSLANGVTSGLTSGGTAITLSLTGGKVVGMAGGVTVFDIEVNSSGQVTLSQYGPIDHPTNSPSESVTLANNLVTLTRTVTVTDGDGDTATGSSAITLSGITFQDDGPSIGTPGNATVNEANFSNGSAPNVQALIKTGDLQANFGGDGGTLVKAQFTAADTIAALNALGLQSNTVNLNYALSTDGTTITATAGQGGAQVFTIVLNATAGTGGNYTFTLKAPLDHGTEATKVLTLPFTVTDTDGDTASSSFTVTVLDDVPNTTTPGEFTLTVVEDSTVSDPKNTFNTSADANSSNTKLVDVNGDPLTATTDNSSTGGSVVYENVANGTVTIHADGSISYEPNADYSNRGGSDTFIYRTTNNGDEKTVTVTVNVTPVADAPTLPHDTTATNVTAATVSTQEDTAVELKLKQPVVKDAIDQTSTAAGDYPERLDAITLTIGGAGASGVTLSTGGKALTPVDGKITIVLTDTSGSDQPSASHVTGSLVPAKNESQGVYYLTQGEYEAIQALPGEHRHENFTVTVEVTSYEVNAAGEKLADVAGANSQQAIEVAVEAVTDNVALTFNTSKAGGDATVTGLPNESYTAVYSDNKNATVTLKEEATFNLKDLLVGSFADLDGSEVRSITIVNTSGSAITVNGVALEAGATLTTPISAPGLSTSIDGFPDIRIGAGENFSGTIDGIQITLNAQDKDADGFLGTTGTPTNPANGQAETDTSDNTVTLNLSVPPRAGDVAADNVDTLEDTAVAFLQHVRVTDGGTGSEVIDSVSFTVPAGWTLTQQPAAGSAGDAIWTVTGSGTDAAPYVITFTAGTESNREAALKLFEIKPPAHSSLDATINVKVTSTDTNGAVTDTVEDKNLPIKITVTPVAERVDSDTGGTSGNDVIMNDSHVYTGQSGKEDQWFALGNDIRDATNTGVVDLAAPWSNEDSTSEFTYAALTPVLTSASTGDSVNGTTFRYHDGSDWNEIVFNGEAVWVPLEYLNTLQIKAPENVSGTLTVTMQAATVDYDDDTAKPATQPDGPISSIPGVVDVQLSGEALLTIITIAPVADDVTMSVTGKAKGNEDTKIALQISGVSSDPSEAISVKIEGIPVGATIHYGTNQSFTATAGNTTYTITDFNGTNQGPVSITPPAQWSGSIPLDVSSWAVDGTDTSAPQTRKITVQVVGVADDVTITPSAPGVDANVVKSEADMDAGGHVNLADLFAPGTTADTTNPAGNDGSETISYRVSGLPSGFTLQGATLISGGAGGEARVWSVSSTQLANVKISVPENFSGVQTLKIQGISTEADGNSKTMPAVDLRFQVTPSVDGIANTGNSAVVEDVRSALGLEIVHQNGDTDETLGDVWIRADQISTSGYTLYLNDNVLTGTPGTPPGYTGNDTFIRVDASQVASIQVQGAPHLDGELGQLDFFYEVIDSRNGSTVTGTPGDVQLKSGTFTISASAVTDAITLGLDVSAAANVTVNPGNDINVTAPGAIVTVNLDVDSADTDGSEHVVRVIIEGVPEGVTVIGGEQISATTWVLVRSDAINSNGASIPVRFSVSDDAGGLTDHEITMTVQVKDRGNEVGYTLTDSDRQQDAVTWTLSTDFAKGSGAAPAVINEWKYSGAHVSEDAVKGPHTLADLIDATVTVADGSVNNTFTVSLTDVPDGTTITGMVLTNVDGKPTWTATLVVPSGGNANVLLEAFLKDITLTPPADSNLNNAPGGFNFNATLSTSAGGTTNSKEIPKSEMIVEVDPVTDAAAVTVVVSDQNENPATGSSIPVTITVGTPVDGRFGSIVGDVMYVKVNATGDNAGGTLLVGNGDALTPIASGPHAGSYPVPVTAGTAVSLEYVPLAGTAPGSVTFDVVVETVETNAPDQTPVTGNGSGTVNVLVANNGIKDPGLEGPGETLTTGDESDNNVIGNAIVLPAFSTELVDAKEGLSAVMLDGVPVGFLVYVNGVLATNAGGDGTTNIWVLKEDGLLATDEVAVLPPSYWSGTVTGMNLLVESGETTLENQVQTFQLGTLEVTPVANGLTINPTRSFGTEGQIIALRLNATMEDPAEVVAAVADGSTETTTVQLTGLGAHASFYVGTTAIDASQITYAAANGGTYTIERLSQTDLGQLGFVQANAALTDQDSTTAGLQVGVTAWTVESGNVDASDPTDLGHITLNLQDQRATAGNDTLLWTGKAINGLAGQDTVALRQGESVSGADLGLGLKNIEKLDLSVEGENQITDLTPEQVKAIVGNGALLEILGTSDDGLSLGTGWTSNGGGSYSGGTGANAVTLKVSGVSVIDFGSSVADSQAAYALPPANPLHDELNQPIVSPI